VETKLYGKSCAEPSVLTQHSEINVIVVPEYSKNPFMVACDQLSQGGGWTIFLRRTDGSEEFFRDWNDYKNGFGKLENEFFLGLDKLHAITSSQTQELLVLLEDNEGDRRYQMYDNFKIGSEQDGFNLESLGNTSGNAGDALATHLGQKFTTKDRDNDKHATANCATTYSSAWWYTACHHRYIFNVNIFKILNLLFNMLLLSLAIWLANMAITPMERASTGISGRGIPIR